MLASLYTVLAAANEVDDEGITGPWTLLLWIVAAVFVIWGLVTIVTAFAGRRTDAIASGIIKGVLLVVLGLIIGPGGVSVLS